MIKRSTCIDRPSSFVCNRCSVSLDIGQILSSVLTVSGFRWLALYLSTYHHKLSETGEQQKRVMMERVEAMIQISGCACDFCKRVRLCKNRTRTPNLKGPCHRSQDTLSYTQL